MLKLNYLLCLPIHRHLKLRDCFFESQDNLREREDKLRQAGGGGAGSTEKDIRQSYTGAAVDVYFPLNMNLYYDTFDLLYYYDANSLYPTIMDSLEMPVGKPIAFEGDITQFELDAFGLFYCKFTTHNYIEHTILQRRF